jgi:hypothetical protein
MLKRYFSFFTLALFLLNTVVYPLLSYVELHAHRYVMGEKAKELEKQVTLQIAFAEMNAGDGWMNEKEFSFKGDHYDVFSFVENEDHIILKCVKDTEEKNIFEKLARYIDSDKDKKAPGNKNVSLKKTADYFSEAHPQFHLAGAASSLINTGEVDLHSSANIPVASPPPRLGCLF